MPMRILLIFGLILSISATILTANADQSSVTRNPPTNEKPDKTNDNQKETDGRGQLMPSGPSTRTQHTQQVAENEYGHEGYGKSAPWRNFSLTDMLLAVFTLALAIVGWLQYRTLRISVKVAAKSTEIAERVAVSTKRAFVILKDITWVQQHQKSIDGSIASYKTIVWTLGPQWGNSGDTFANATLRANCQILENVPPKGFQFPYVPLDDQRFKYKCDSGTKVSLWPKAEIGSEPLLIQGDEESFKSVINGVSRLFVWGEAKYDDTVSGQTTHNTRFCGELTFRKGYNLLEPQPLIYLTDYNHVD